MGAMVKYSGNELAQTYKMDVLICLPLQKCAHLAYDLRDALVTVYVALLELYYFNSL